jgi:hypothetical protein
VCSRLVNRVREMDPNSGGPGQASVAASCFLRSGAWHLAKRPRACPVEKNRNSGP